MNLSQGAWYRTDVDGAENTACVDVQALADALPHGSGIDGDWRIEVKKNGSVRVYGSFHEMDENGSYDGWRDFSIRVHRVKADVLHELRGPCAGKVQAYPCAGDVVMSLAGGGRNGDYLHELIHCALTEAKVIYSRSELRDIR